MVLQNNRRRAHDSAEHSGAASASSEPQPAEAFAADNADSVEMVSEVHEGNCELQRGTGKGICSITMVTMVITQ